jgi:type IV secretory pathway TraG/TraD family ATPase VirD4
LLLPYEVLQLDAEQVVVFAAGTSPARLQRIDWRNNPTPRELAHRPPQPYQLSRRCPWPSGRRHRRGTRQVSAAARKSQHKGPGRLDD